MTINVIQLVVICVLAGLAYYANNALNGVPVLRNVMNVLIICVGVLLVLQSLGVLGGGSPTIRIN